jgi:hypothetical protein
LLRENPAGDGFGAPFNKFGNSSCRITSERYVSTLASQLRAIAECLLSTCSKPYNPWKVSHRLIEIE